MGLDTSHGAWHGAYGSFARWRNAVARAAGIPVEVDRGNSFLYPDGVERYVLDWSLFVEANYYGQWETPPDDPILILLVHSDCEGEIRPGHAGPLADRLEELLPQIVNDPHRDHQAHARQFIAGLRAAAAAGEPVDFH